MDWYKILRMKKSLGNHDLEHSNFFCTTIRWVCTKHFWKPLCGVFITKDRKIHQCWQDLDDIIQTYLVPMSKRLLRSCGQPHWNTVSQIISDGVSWCNYINALISHIKLTFETSSQTYWESCKFCLTGLPYLQPAWSAGHCKQEAKFHMVTETPQDPL